jgi:hypothetical protein
VPDGLIHDWIGATCIPGATIENTLAVVQDYDNHKNTYQPEVIGSKLIGHQENDFQILPAAPEEKDHHRNTRHVPRRAIFLDQFKTLGLPLPHYSHF